MSAPYSTASYLFIRMLYPGRPISICPPYYHHLTHVHLALMNSSPLLKINIKGMIHFFPLFPYIPHKPLLTAFQTMEHRVF